ncbi:hypothetical protein LTR44_003021 [Exophiala sp. CCFEE 6388]|uniref:Transcription factor domain-containing protein n=1 Tax=Exophiala sideris TaxID=1016849 RepID=A0ABR0JCI5_9EURO|nr:hypothetical protein LTR69_004831 [Exophiala sideris]KAK5184348.1 hypothetical protein LTR44_003021 [Eurotiomycetes sp. CCFEE 6388]
MVDRLVSELNNIAVTQFQRTRTESAILGPFSALAFPRSGRQSSPRLEQRPVFGPDSWLSLGTLDRGSWPPFHHYVSVIASKMMPFEDARNPWKTQYPCMALNGEVRAYLAIRHAMLSQAAAHLQHIGHRTTQMKVLSMSHYSESLKALSAYLQQTTEYDYGAVLAGILSLIMAETYQGDSIAWRHHVRIAWDLATKSLPQKPWLLSETAWLTTQSLCMLKLRMTMDLEQDDPPAEIQEDGGTWQGLCQQKDEAYMLQEVIASVSSRLEMGFTVGASPPAVAMLNEAVTLSCKVRHCGLTDILRSQIESLTDTLSAFATAQGKGLARIRGIHERIFTLGIIVFLQRHTIDPTPRALLPYTSSLFACVQMLDDFVCQDWSTDGIRRDSSRVSLWPVFLAAVECFRQQEPQIAHSWLQNLSTSGIGNRSDVSKVLHGVWRERRRKYFTQTGGTVDLTCSKAGDEGDYTAVEKGCLPTDTDGFGDIVVHWREVMRAQEIDISLYSKSRRALRHDDRVAGGHVGGCHRRIDHSFTCVK